MRLIVGHTCEMQSTSAAGRWLGELRGRGAGAACVGVPAGVGVLGAVEVEEGGMPCGWQWGERGVWVGGR